jgi:hypothetical protein
MATNFVSSSRPGRWSIGQDNKLRGGNELSFTYCVTSTCPLRKDCERFEDDAANHCVFRTYADFSEELIREKDNKVSCPFFMTKTCALQQDAA